MADFKKPTRQNLPPPPPPEEATQNLQAPEVAPIDRRSLRATGRTVQLATRVTSKFHHDLRVYAAQRDLKLVEVLEQAFDALLDRNRQNSSR